MINHVRTLLRNTWPEPYAGLPGQEIIDPGFRPVVLPPHLAAIRAVLFGRRPDRDGLDLKLRRYLAILHATRLVDAVQADDPRMTYLAPVVDQLEFNFQPQILLVKQQDYPLYLSGDPPGEDGGGALLYVWNVTVLTSHP